MRKVQEGRKGTCCSRLAEGQSPERTSSQGLFGSQGLKVTGTVWTAAWRNRNEPESCSLVESGGGGGITIAITILYNLQAPMGHCEELLSYSQLCSRCLESLTQERC